jgi:hypothetical protein
MPIIENVTYFKCEFCSKQFLDATEAEKHENTCSKNPKVQEIERLKDKFQAQAEEIRLTSKTIPEVIERTIKLLDDNGVELILNEYPHIFSTEISNSREAPIGYQTNWGGDKKDVPRNYPGWRGKWEGTIKYKQNHPKYGKEINFDNLYDRWGRAEYAINYIKAGGGNFGSKFSMGGTLWLYDFPLIYKEWQKNNGEFNILKDEYRSAVNEYETQFHTVRTAWVKDRPDMKPWYDLNERLKTLVTQCQDAIDTNVAFYKNEFNKTYEVDIPVMTSAFVDISDFIKASNLIKTSNTILEPNKISILQLSEKLEKMLNEYNEYITEYPERFY